MDKPMGMTDKEIEQVTEEVMQSAKWYGIKLKHFRRYFQTHAAAQEALVGWGCVRWLLEHGERAPVLMKSEPMFGLLGQVRHEMKRINRRKKDA